MEPSSGSNGEISGRRRKLSINSPTSDDSKNLPMVEPSTTAQVLKAAQSCSDLSKSAQLISRHPSREGLLSAAGPNPRRGLTLEAPKPVRAQRG